MLVLAVGGGDTPPSIKLETFYLNVATPPSTFCCEAKSGSGQFSGAPSGQFSGAPSGQFSGAPSGQFSGAPSGQFSGAWKSFSQRGALCLMRVTPQCPAAGPCLRH